MSSAEAQSLLPRHNWAGALAGQSLAALWLTQPDQTSSDADWTI